ncbi:MULTISPECIES: hypothetical protein [Natrialba]|uniref:Uncharacterized protein n=1 Tax=Natrialba swarupiae TaxID=2448032 RepID=A0A5D5AR72_9EURY|nr:MULTISPECIES: hypothetical protein [Natrialba]MWV38285.1 hypothetical protein [Natrialba sp. INN-245]TYT62322.1 hypothetical protein FYC77_08875 [Natrialba swarupiae]
MSLAEEVEVESATSVSFVCEDCGRVHNRNNPPCNDCGSMRLSAVEDVADSQEIDERESWQIVRDANRGITGLGVLAYVVGTLTFLGGSSLLVLGGFHYGTLLLGGWIIGVSWTAAGIVAIPAIRRRLERRFDVYPSSRTVLGLYLVLVVGSVVLATFT